MYTPEINFLKGRGPGEISPISPTDSTQDFFETRKEPSFLDGAGAIVIGVVVAAILLGGYGAFQFFASQRLEELRAEQAAVDTALAQAQGELAALRQTESEVQAIQTRTTAFQTFFNQLQPWSAILQDVRSQVPANVWITELSTSGNTVSIVGQSLSFDQVNDFQLTLLSSPLVDEVELVSATANEGNPDQGIGPSVDYGLNVTLSRRSLQELTPELQALGSTGLVNKIEILNSLESTNP